MQVHEHELFSVWATAWAAATRDHLYRRATNPRTGGRPTQELAVLSAGQQSKARHRVVDCGFRQQTGDQPENWQAAYPPGRGVDRLLRLRRGVSRGGAMTLEENGVVVSFIPNSREGRGRCMCVLYVCICGFCEARTSDIAHPAVVNVRARLWRGSWRGLWRVRPHCERKRHRRNSMTHLHAQAKVVSIWKRRHMSVQSFRPEHDVKLLT
mgnify:FL=1